ncbi:calcium-binding protein, partial [Paraburkholderia podalyriae]
WYCYLEEQLSFPFEAGIRQAMASSPLHPGEHVSVTGLAHEDLCRVGIFVWARWGQRDVVAPLAQIVPLNSDQPTRLAVADWHYWHDQGYAF